MYHLRISGVVYLRRKKLTGWGNVLEFRTGMHEFSQTGSEDFWRTKIPFPLCPWLWPEIRSLLVSYIGPVTSQSPDGGEPVIFRSPTPCMWLAFCSCCFFSSVSFEWSWLNHLKTILGSETWLKCHWCSCRKKTWVPFPAPTLNSS